MGVQFWFQTWQQSPTKMSFKILSVFTICLIGLSLAVPMPWVQGGAVSDAAALETDLENPLTADPSDPHIFYNFRYPMTFVSMDLVVEPARRNLLHKELKTRTSSFSLSQCRTTLRCKFRPSTQQRETRWPRLKTVSKSR